MLFKTAEDLHERALELSFELRRSAALPAAFDHFVNDVVSTILDLTPTEESHLDPYLLWSLMGGAMRLQRALRARDRREGRIALEQVRVALRDIAEQQPVAPTRDAHALAQWLDGVLTDLSDDEKGRLAGVTRRTWGRWLAQESTPGPQETARLRQLARAVAHLRFSFTPAGVASWLQRAHPQLDGRTPLETLKEPERAEFAVRLASQSRATVAS